MGIKKKVSKTLFWMLSIMSFWYSQDWQTIENSPLWNAFEIFHGFVKYQVIPRCLKYPSQTKLPCFMVVWLHKSLTLSLLKFKVKQNQWALGIYSLIYKTVVFLICIFEPSGKWDIWYGRWTFLLQAKNLFVKVYTNLQTFSWKGSTLFSIFKCIGKTAFFLSPQTKYNPPFPVKWS